MNEQVIDVDNNCNFYCINDDLPTECNSLNIFHINIRSVKANMDELLINLKNLKSKFNVLVLTETWLNS